MNIQWEVDDGYVNTDLTTASRFGIDIDDEEIAEYETLDEKIEFISEIIQEDFQQRVSWSADIRKALLTNGYE